MTFDVPPIGPWQTARVADIRVETPRAKTFVLDLEQPTGHAAGQHYVVRLTAADGYQASRSYSVASAPGDPARIELTVDRLPDGEVSTFFHDVVVVGDEFEVRGPIGGWFVWDGESPALLLGGGSGIVPLMSMLRWARQRSLEHPAELVVSVRTPDDLYYAGELSGPEVTVLYTREGTPDDRRPPGRLSPADVATRIGPRTIVYVCGSSGFVEAATTILDSLAVPREHVRVERFGPTS